ncbi:hypothetical protein HT136_16295 [Novosphingobium profundi]|uniref:hypothetical protein n=1 Tax=Novosphingobium profundi TaxID=1774954 RepID=UPI001BDAFEA9|nr:hypothetical protein [Novosphingobium profundi]
MPVADGLPPPPALEAPAPSAVTGPAFDLATLDANEPDHSFHAVRPRCTRASRPGEIVVCAPDPEAERLGDTGGFRGYTAPEGKGLPRAAIDFGEGARLDLHLDTAVLPNGMVSNRVMVGIKVPF